MSRVCWRSGRIPRVYKPWVRPTRGSFCVRHRAEKSMDMYTKPDAIEKDVELWLNTKLQSIWNNTSARKVTVHRKSGANSRWPITDKVMEKSRKLFENKRVASVSKRTGDVSRANSRTKTVVKKRMSEIVSDVMLIDRGVTAAASRIPLKDRAKEAAGRVWKTRSCHHLTGGMVARSKNQ